MCGCGVSFVLELGVRVNGHFVVCSCIGVGVVFALVAFDGANSVVLIDAGMGAGVSAGC